MSSEVPWLPLEDLVEDIIDRRGVTPLKLGGEFTKFGHRVISAKLLKAGRVDLQADEARFVNATVYAKWMKGPLLQGDVLMTSEAPLGELAFVDQTLDWCLGQRLFAIRPKKHLLDGRYAFYALQTPKIREDLLGRATGTTVQGIRQSELRRVKLPVPDLPLQIAAAGALRALDDRIALLRETNATLEAIAQALFKSWFVDFNSVRAKSQGLAPAGMEEATAALFPDCFEEAALGLVPKGWTVGTLGNVCVNPRVGAKPKHLPEQTPYVGLEHMPRRSIALVDAGTAKGLESGKFWFARDDVLFGKLRPYFHKVALAPTRGVCSTDILVLRSTTQSFLGFVAMHASSDALIAHATLLSNGARMPRSSWHDIAGFPVVLPPEKVASAFSDIAYRLFERIYANIEMAKILGETRDTLLPRLMSGQLRLPEAEAALA